MDPSSRLCSVLRSSLLLMGLGVSGAPALAQTTWVVDDNGTGDFVHIQDAVDAAASGDVIHVLAGGYAGFTIDAKSLVVAAASGASVQVAAYVIVRNLDASQKVELEGLRIGATFSGVGGESTVQLFDNMGSVRIVDCEISSYLMDGNQYGRALQCQASEDVGVLRSDLSGGGGDGYYWYGVEGILASSSNLEITECTVSGGDGTASSALCVGGGYGGTALSAFHSTIICTDSTFQGGTGEAGNCPPLTCFPSGCPGGDGGGFFLGTGASGTWKNSTFNGQPGPETGDFARTEFAAFCFGTWEECPCGNNGIPGAGCETSYSSGGVKLSAAGTSSVSGDTVTLSATGFRPTAAPSGLFFQGTTQLAGGMGVVLNDGLLCTGGEIIRLKSKIALNGSMALGFGIPGDPPVSSLGSIPPGGGTRNYQVWYRNQAAQFCTVERFNMSNALEVTWVP